MGPVGSWVALLFSELFGGLLAACLFRMTHRGEFIEVAKDLVAQTQLFNFWPLIR